MIWRSVGLNFARWVKAEKAKMKPKVEAGAGEAERPSKRRKAEETGRTNSGMSHTAGPAPHPGPRAPYNEPSAARASVLVRPVEQVTPEQRRRQIMAMWYVFSRRVLSHSLTLPLLTTGSPRTTPAILIPISVSNKKSSGPPSCRKSSAACHPGKARSSPLCVRTSCSG